MGVCKPLGMMCMVYVACCIRLISLLIRLQGSSRLEGSCLLLKILGLSILPNFSRQIGVIFLCKTVLLLIHEKVVCVLSYLSFYTENIGRPSERPEGNSLCLQCQDQLYDAL